MSVKDISLRPIQEADIPRLAAARQNYWDADLEVPYGYSVPGSVETAVAEKDGEWQGALVATKVVVYDFIKNAEAKGVDIFAAVLMLERAMSYVAQSTGVTTSYLAIPSHLTEYVDMVKRCGYEVGFENCTILRRPLRQEIMGSIREARDANSR
jgi:hypothetical protein